MDGRRTLTPCALRQIASAIPIAQGLPRWILAVHCCLLGCLVERAAIAQSVRYQGAPVVESAVPPDEFGAISRLPSLGETPPRAMPGEMPLAETAPALPTLGLARQETVSRRWAASPVERPRSEALERVARQADRQTRHGFDLAGRGAYFAARTEFVGALRLIAGALDTERQTDLQSRALTAALKAMREADDFWPNGRQLERDIDLTRLISCHETPVLKGTPTNVTAMTAMQRYFTYAQEQFAMAAGNEVAGSMALHALGKLHIALAKKKNRLEAAAESKAVVYYQAALLACPENFMASNDLGVLLAQFGRYREAQTMLEYSAAIRPLSTTLHNLAVVYRQTGQMLLAAGAAQKATSLEQAEVAQRKVSAGTRSVGVQWADPGTFATTSTNSANSLYASPRPPMQAAWPSVEPGRLPSEGPTASAPNATGSAGRTVSGRSRSGAAPSSAERISWGLPAYQR